jgi:hypothetical protein
MRRGIVLALLLLEGVAWADDPVAVARQAVAESDYVAARPVLTAALEGGGRSPEDLVEISRLSGIVEAALGDAKAATEAFTRLLALSPRAALPDGTSPKIRRPFDAAARYIADHAGLEVRTETASQPPTITLVVVSDPLNMVAAARAVFIVDGGPERTTDVEASERTAIVLPAGRRIDARVAALDAHGNRLVEIGSREVPIVIVGEAPAVIARPPPPPRKPPVVARAAPPLYRRWWPYAAASVAFAGATGYFAWSTHSATDELEQIIANSVPHRFGDARAVEDRARRDALLTNIGLGVTGAFALAAGAMYLLTPRDHVETRVTAVPVRGGGAVVLGGTF